MDFRKLKICHIQLYNGKVYLGANFQEDEAKIASQEMSRQYFEKAWKDREMRITGKGYSFTTKIKEVECTSSIIDNKIMHFLTTLHDIGKIKENDLIEII